MASLDEVEAVARSIVDPHLADTVTDRGGIPQVPSLRTFDPSNNLSSCSDVTQFCEPSPKRHGLPDFEHVSSTVDGALKSTKWYLGPHCQL